MYKTEKAKDKQLWRTWDWLQNVFWPTRHWQLRSPISLPYSRAIGRIYEKEVKHDFHCIHTSYITAKYWTGLFSVLSHLNFSMALKIVITTAILQTSKLILRKWPRLWMTRREGQDLEFWKTWGRIGKPSIRGAPFPSTSVDKSWGSHRAMEKHLPCPDVNI